MRIHRFRIVILLVFVQIERINCLLPATNNGSFAVGRRKRLIVQEAACVSDNVEGIRLNKVLKATHSRREADRLIQEGRLTVNGEISLGKMVLPFVDQVHLDGRLVTGWEELNGFASDPRNQGYLSHNTPDGTEAFEYIKYWKPKGVICTTDSRIHNNIVEVITQQHGYNPKHRFYPVGRLDKDTSGLILLSSDGRLPNASLRRSQKQSKVYRVRVDKPLTELQLNQLRSGVVITTVAQRDGKKAPPLTSKTKPCQVKRLTPTSCEMVLQEGRNRQIRKMMEALGLEVVDLHRVAFGDVSIKGLKHEGDWKRLNIKEMEWVKKVTCLDIASID